MKIFSKFLGLVFRSPPIEEDAVAAATEKDDHAKEKSGAVAVGVEEDNPETIDRAAAAAAAEAEAETVVPGITEDKVADAVVEEVLVYPIFLHYHYRNPEVTKLLDGVLQMCFASTICVVV